MQLEVYFDFLDPLDIRIRGSRVGIETVLGDYRELGLGAEEIAARYRTLSLEQVYATLTYYWRNQATVDDYLRRVEEEIARQRREFALNPPPGVQRLRELARQRDEARRGVATAP